MIPITKNYEKINVNFAPIQGQHDSDNENSGKRYYWNHFQSILMDNKKLTVNQNTAGVTSPPPWCQKMDSSRALLHTVVL